MAEVSSILKQTQNLPNAEKLGALNRQAEQMLKGLKTSILKGLDVVDKGYEDRLASLQAEVGDFKTRTGSSSMRDMRTGALQGRSNRNQLEMSRLRDVVKVATQLVEIESKLKNSPKELNARTDLFVQTQTLLKSFDNTKLENTELIKGYGYRLRAINPTAEIADKWLELVVLTESEMTVPASLGKIVVSIGKLGKLDFFRAKLYPKLIDLIQLGKGLTIENGATLRVSKTDTNFVASLTAVRDFVRHLDQIGLGPDSDQSSKLMSNLIETYLKRNVPCDPSKTGPIKQAIQLCSTFVKFLDNVEVGEVDRFSANLPKLISKSKVAKTLEDARKIINDSNSSLFDAQLAPSEAQNESNVKSSSDNRIAIYFKDENQCQFQATQFPISKRTLKLWSLMCANPAASKMISVLFISMMPELYQVRFETDYKLASLYYSDVQWMIGGLAKLTHLNKFGELEKLSIVSLIPRLQNSATTVISIHLERLKNDIDSVLTQQLSKISKMENQYIYDEVSKTLEQSIAIVNIASDDMSKILPEPVAKPLIAQLINHIGLTLQSRIVDMEDIPSDLCTPLDNLLTLCETLPSHADCHIIEDLRFMLRSSLLEIVAAYKNTELQLPAGQIRSLIRALFSNTEHRQSSLAQIK